jgi:hypothetical protein
MAHAQCAAWQLCQTEHGRTVQRQVASEVKAEGAEGVHAALQALDIRPDENIQQVQTAAQGMNVFGECHSCMCIHDCSLTGHIHSKPTV